MENLDKPGIENTTFEILLDRKYFQNLDILIPIGNYSWASKSALQEAKNHAMVKRMKPNHRVYNMWTMKYE